MNVVETLKAARKKIEGKFNWTQGAAARDVIGDAVNADSQYAVSWCALGAIDAVCPKDEYAIWCSCLNHLSNACPNHPEKMVQMGVLSVNDRGTHEGVLKLYDDAIALAMKELG